MTNNIGYSSIYPNAGQGPAGPQGPQGPTGANQTVKGSTGATGIDSNYITEILVNNETGQVTLVFSDDTLDYNAGILTGATGIYAGITALSLGGLSPILRGVCGGITLDFYNFQAIDLIGVTYDSSGNLKFTISPNTTAGGISADTENNRVVYAKGKTYIMSTDMIPQVSSTTNSVGNTAYHYINFGGETAGRNVVADITENLLTVGPVGRGGTIVSTETFFTSGPQGICLDVSRGSVFKLVTPIGVAEFNTKDSPMTDGQIMSVTLIVEGDDVWNFPSNVYFDQDSGAVFYPGTNILHMWKGTTFDYWNAHFTARGFGIDTATNPGLRGSCCYFDADGTKHCDDYVTENYCIERNGTFEGLIPCTKNSCVISEDKQFDGICCSEGHCISDLDPNLCQTIGGYFISGITCGVLGSEYPETANTDNYTGLCYNKCKPQTICCRDGECLGHLTKIHCEEILGGKIVNANSCTEAKCCDHVLSPGACCIPQQDGSFECVENVQTPYECNVELGGVYMGKNTNCQNNICCAVPTITTCYECVHQPGQCIETERQITNALCSQFGYNDLPGQCNLKLCHKCDCIQGCVPLEVCGECPDGYSEGACIPDPCGEKEKTCYSGCNYDILECTQETVTLQACDNRTCSQLVEDGVITNPELQKDSCDCEQYAACFWCFPTSGGYSSSGLASLGSANPSIYGSYVEEKSYAPYRSVVLVSKETALALENAITLNILPTVTEIKLLSGKIKTLGYEKTPISNKYYPNYQEIPSEDVNHFYDLGSFISGGDVVQNPFPERVGPIYSVGQNVPFKCYYVSNFKYDTNESQSAQKERCLTAIGYDVEDNDEKSCQICDRLSDITAQFYGTEESTYTNFEPYQEEFKNRKLFAPFPPVWGRITYNAELSTCSSTSHYAKDSAVLGGLISPIGNAISFGYGGLHFMLDYAHGRNNQPKLKNYWQNILKEYAKSFRDDQGEPINYPNRSNQVSTKIQNNLIELLGNNAINLDVRGIIESGQILTDLPGGNNYDQLCTLIGTDLGVLHIRFDPYLKGLNYNNSLQNYPQLTGIIQYGLPKIFNCSICTFGKSWHFIMAGITDQPLGRVTKDFAPIDKYYYVDTGSYVGLVGGDSNATLSGVGEFYHVVSIDSGGFALVPAIYGRNLRYNLDAFRTSTVFFNMDGTKTMKESDTIVVPIFWDNYLQYQAPPLGPCEWNPFRLGSFCYGCGYNALVGVGGGNGGSGPITIKPCCCDGDEAEPDLCGWYQDHAFFYHTCARCGDGNPWIQVTEQYTCCPDLCSLVGFPTVPGDPGEVVFSSHGFIVPSTIEASSGGGVGFAPIQFAQVDTNITTKRVQLTPGICVDMLCPECNNYESC